MKARLTFAREHRDKDQHFWNNILQTEESNIELYGLNRGHVRRKLNTIFQEQKLVGAVKHRGGSVVVWRCCVAAGPGLLTQSEGSGAPRESICKKKIDKDWLKMVEMEH